MESTLVQNTEETIMLSANESRVFLVLPDSRLTIELCGVGAEAKVCGVFFGSDNEKQQMNVTVKHLVPHTTSHILIVGALKDQAAATIEGTIEIAPGAYGSNGREEIKTLLLSKDASVRAIPELKIENNDVQCSHAVSTTHIDEEKKFYLESRGMSETEAINTVVEGHFARVLEQARDLGLRERIQKVIKKV